ncbi:MAG: hypothetical protein ACTH64_07270, partial [Providencia sp.]
MTGDNLNLNDAITQADKLQIQGQNLSHQRGKMLQTGSENGEIKLTQTLDNQSGNISSQGTLNLDVNKLANQQGVVVAAKAGALILNAKGGVDNTQGIQANNITLTTQKNRVDNNQGEILASQTLSLKSGEFDNQQGRVQAGQQLSFNTYGQLLNNNDTQKSGGLLSGGRLTLNSGKLTNQQGQIQSAAASELTTQVLNNQQGQIYSGGLLDINTQKNKVLNQNGVL